MTCLKILCQFGRNIFLSFSFSQQYITFLSFYRDESNQMCVCKYLSVVTLARVQIKCEDNSGQDFFPSVNINCTSNKENVVDR